jgi:hypothetical protein
MVLQIIVLGYVIGGLREAYGVSKRCCVFDDLENQAYAIVTITCKCIIAKPKEAEGHERREENLYYPRFQPIIVYVFCLQGSINLD